MSAGSPGRPNVLLVVSDEQSLATLGATGNPAARTPHLDGLAAAGTVFGEFSTPFPLCCPSRASLLTGQMPRHHHVLGNWRAIAPELATTGLGRVFTDAGYHTVYVGKWHVPGTTPSRMGFAGTAAIPAVLDGRDRGRYIDEYRRYATGLGYDILPDSIENLTPRDVRTLEDPASPHRGTAEIAAEHYLETWQTTRLLEQLEAAPPDRPWLAVCSYNAPHFPLLAPRPYDTLIDRDQVRLPASWSVGPTTLPDEVATSGYAKRFADLDERGWVDAVAHYAGLCSLVDDQVGRIVDHLRARGQDDRTVIAFTSDHGDMMGAHRLVEKGHLLHYDEALRVPLIVRAPGARAATSSALASMVDLAPTLAELAGVAWPVDGDGRSFAHAVGDGAAHHRDAVFAESVLWDMETESGHGDHIDPAAFDPARDAVNLSVRTAQHHYTYRSRDRDELFDRIDDPGQVRDLASDASHAHDRTRLRGLIADEVEDVFPAVARQLRDAAEPPAETPPDTAGRW